MSSLSQPATTSCISKRRRFQPPITSFFSAATATTSDSRSGSSLSHHHYSAATSSPLPVVSEKIQSSLLTVGMRVRKSVAEGYKTTASIGKMNEKNAFINSDYSYSRGDNIVSQDAELAPFCGTHYHVTVEPYSTTRLSSLADEDRGQFVVTDEGDAFSLPSSSQGSMEADSSFMNRHKPHPHGNHKRSFDSDLDDGADCDYDYDGVLASSSSSGVGRTILHPTLHQQKRRFFTFNSQRQPVTTQDNVNMDVDFEEPSFLRRREEVDADYAARFGCEIGIHDA